MSPDDDFVDELDEHYLTALIESDPDGSDGAHDPRQKLPRVGGRSVGEDAVAMSLEWIDWSTLHERPDELVEGLVFPGRWTAIAAKAKAGKTSLLMYGTTSLSNGNDPLTGRRIDPVTVLYLDAEMGRYDLAERLAALGYDDPTAQLPRWHATDLVPKLDTIEGANALQLDVKRLDARVVVIDGLNGVVSGAEKDDATWRPFFDLTVQMLKRLNVAVITGDNLGKDESLGPRGSSVKVDKPDGVLLLTRTDDGVKLHAHARRTSAYPLDRYLVATGLDGAEALRYRETTTAWKHGTADLAADLDRLGISVEVGRGKARQALTAAGVKCADALLADAIKYRRMVAGDRDSQGTAS